MKKVYIVVRVYGSYCPATEPYEPYGKVVGVFARQSDARRERKRLNKLEGDEYTWFDIIGMSIQFP